MVGAFAPKNSRGVGLSFTLTFLIYPLILVELPLFWFIINVVVNDLSVPAVPKIGTPVMFIDTGTVVVEVDADIDAYTTAPLA
jgi:hypothetical protein